jgi:hypothetical protein
MLTGVLSSASCNKCQGAEGLSANWAESGPADSRRGRAGRRSKRTLHNAPADGGDVLLGCFPPGKASPAARRRLTRLNRRSPVAWCPPRTKPRQSPEPKQEHRPRRGFRRANTRGPSCDHARERWWASQLRQRIFALDLMSAVQSTAAWATSSRVDDEGVGIGRLERLRLDSERLHGPNSV